METLNAYWRMEYIKTPKTDEIFGNPFLCLPELGDDKEAFIFPGIFRNEESATDSENIWLVRKSCI